MLSFLVSKIPRTRTAHLQTLVFDNGASRAWFRDVNGPETSSSSTAPTTLKERRAVNVLPPAATPAAPVTPLDSKNKGPPNIPAPGHGGSIPLPNSSLAPPLHYHIHQRETFYVRRGKAAFYTFPRYPAFFASKSRVAEPECIVVLGPGETMEIPRGVVHSFRNAGTDQELEVEFGLSLTSPPLAVGAGDGKTGVGIVEEAFFRNAWSYRSDCLKAGRGRSLLQVLVFNRRVGVVLMLPGWGRWGSLVLGVLGAWVGRWVMGYRGSWGEYWDGAGREG